MVIRSYRRVFKFERRIYNIGDWQLPFPNGLPLRGVGYAVAAFGAVFILAHLIIVGTVLAVLPWPALYLVLPAWIAAVGMNANPDGRRADRFAWTWVGHNTGRVLRWVRRDRGRDFGRVRVGWDASSTVLRGAKVSGPASVRFMVPVRLEDRWNGWTATGDRDGVERSVLVRDGRVLRVRP